MKLSILRRVPWTFEWGRFGVTTEDTVRIHVELNAKGTVPTSAHAR